MHRSKLIYHLQALDKAELKRLLVFLKSPFYNANPNLLKLYQLLRGYHPDFASSKLSKEKIFRRLFPEKVYNHQKLLNLMSDFTALLKKYLQILELEKGKKWQDRLLIQAYAHRPKCYRTFIKAINKREEQLETVPYQDAEYHRQKFELSQWYIKHPATDKFKLSKKQYDYAMQQLDHWYLHEKILLSCEMKAREKPLSEEYDIWLLSEMRKEASQYLSSDTAPILGIYNGMLDLLEQESTEAYTRLKVNLMEHSTRFTRRQKQDLLQSLINFTIRQGNQGKQEFLQENLELYQFGLQEELLLEQGILNDMVYISIVNVALRSGALEWCQAFIRTYAEKLEPSTRKDAEALATALWLYAAREPVPTVELLRRIEFLNVYYQIQARVLLIKVYFEAFQLDDTYFDLIISQTESFERFLRRNKKVSKTQRVALLNFILAVKQSARLQFGNGHDPRAKRRLWTEIKKQEPFYNKSWFLHQLEHATKGGKHKDEKY